VDGVSGGEVAAATTTQRPGPRTTEAPDGGRPRARRRGGVYFAWGAADGAWGEYLTVGPVDLQADLGVWAGVGL